MSRRELPNLVRVGEYATTCRRENSNDGIEVALQRGLTHIQSHYVAMCQPTSCKRTVNNRFGGPCCTIPGKEEESSISNGRCRILKTGSNGAIKVNRYTSVCITTKLSCKRVQIETFLHMEKSSNCVTCFVEIQGVKVDECHVRT